MPWFHDPAFSCQDQCDTCLDVSHQGSLPIVHVLKSACLDGTQSFQFREFFPVHQCTKRGIWQCKTHLFGVAHRSSFNLPSLGTRQSLCPFRPTSAAYLCLRTHSPLPHPSLHRAFGGAGQAFGMDSSSRQAHMLCC